MDYPLSTPQEVAAALGISVRAVHRRAHEGSWPPGSVLDFGQGLRRYRLDLIEADALERAHGAGRRHIPPTTIKRRRKATRAGRPASQEAMRRHLLAI